MSSHPPHGSDTAAGFTGLIVGALVVGGILFATVKVTNAHYAGEKAEAKAEATK